MLQWEQLPRISIENEQGSHDRSKNNASDKTATFRTDFVNVIAPIVRAPAYHVTATAMETDASICKAVGGTAHPDDIVTTATKSQKLCGGV